MRTTLPLLFLFTACGDWAPPTPEATTTGMSGISLAGTTSGETGDWPLPERGAPDVAPPPMPGTTGGPPMPGTATDETTAEGGPRVDLAALRIVEVLPDPVGKDGGASSPEFVEIFNHGGAATALAGLEIVARAWPVLDAAELGIAGEWLEPGQRLVVLRYAAAVDLPDPPLVIGDAGISVAFAHADGLRNDDGGVLLRAAGELGDLVIFGAAQPAPWDSQAAWTGPAASAPGVGVALCRVGDVDSDAAGDFAACSPSPGGAGEEPGESTGTPTNDTGEDPVDTTGVVDETTGTDSSTGEPLPAEVVIVEVLSNPPGPGNGEKADEFVELLNLGPGAVDLAGWTIADSLADDADGVDPLLYSSGDGGCAPATCLAAGGRAIVVGGAYTGPTGAGLVLVTDDTTLANAGLAVHEPVVVRDADGVTRSTYRAWEDPLVAPDPAATEEALVRDPAATDTPEAWSFAAPTPGD
jgi:hypothetical protein